MKKKVQEPKTIKNHILNYEIEKQYKKGAKMFLLYSKKYKTNLYSISKDKIK